MKILISPFSKPLRNGKRNPKNYPFWDALVELLKKDGHTITQLAFGNEDALKVDSVLRYTKLAEVEKSLREHDLFISIDNFLQHLAHYHGFKGIVLWGKSDPKLFGYPENVNVVKDEKYIRKRQFDIWEAEEYEEKVFEEPKKVVEYVKEFELSKK